VVERMENETQQARLLGSFNAATRTKEKSAGIGRSTQFGMLANVTFL